MPRTRVTFVVPTTPPPPVDTTAAADPTIVTTTPPAEAPATFSLPNKSALLRLATSFALGCLVYWLGYYILSSNGVNFFLSNLIGYVIGLIFLAFVDSALKSKTEIGTAVTTLMTLILIICLSVHYLPGYDFGKKKAPIHQSAFSETGTVRNVNEIWFTDKVFSSGAEVEIEVLYNEVVMTNVGQLNPGTYHKIIPGDGKLMFEGISSSPSRIKVSYK